MEIKPNYTGITLLSTQSKVYESKIAKWIQERRKYLRSHFYYQTVAGGNSRIRKGLFPSSCRLELAFDTVLRKMITECLRQQKIIQQLHRTILSIYKETKDVIKTNNTE